MAFSNADPESRSVVFYVDGFPLPKNGFDEETFRRVLRLPVRPNDIILSTYPKCGTTWTQYIIWGLLNEGKPAPSVNRIMFKDFPFMELVGPEAFHALPEPRLAKFHLPYDMTPKCSGCRLVHVLRNPFDACVSMWHHVLEFDAPVLNIDLTFDEFFETFISGTCMFGDYFQHETSWYAHRDDPDVLFLTYEAMTSDPSATITDIAEFLGLGDKLRKNNGRLLDDVLRYSSFSYLKENCPFRVSKSTEPLNKMGEKAIEMSIDEETSKDDDLFMTIDFFRKGKVGINRDQFSTSQWQRLEEAIQKRVEDLELRKLMVYPQHYE